MIIHRITNFFLLFFAGIIHQLGSCHLCLVTKRRRNRVLLEMKILVVNQLVNLLRKVITSLDFFFFGNENTKACSFSASKNGNSNDNPISSFVKSKNQDAFIKTLEDNGMKVVNGPGKLKTPVSAKKSSRSSGENAEVGSPANNLKISDFLKNKVREPQSRTPKPSTTSVSGGTPTNNRSQFMKSVSSTLSGNNSWSNLFFFYLM